MKGSYIEVGEVMLVYQYKYLSKSQKRAVDAWGKRGGLTWCTNSEKVWEEEIIRQENRQKAKWVNLWISTTD